MDQKGKKKQGTFCNAPLCGTVPKNDPITGKRIGVLSTTKTRLDLWTEKTGLALFEGYKFCTQHFDPEEIEMTKGGRWRMKKESFYPKHLLGMYNFTYLSN